MNELTLINKNGLLFIDSREVAKATGMRHDNLLKKNNKICENFRKRKIAFSGFLY